MKVSDLRNGHDYYIQLFPGHRPSRYVGTWHESEEIFINEDRIIRLVDVYSVAALPKAEPIRTASIDNLDLLNNSDYDNLINQAFSMKASKIGSGGLLKILFEIVTKGMTPEEYDQTLRMYLKEEIRDAQKYT